MALINCKECKTEISDTAPTCPKCGAKLKMGLLGKFSMGVLIAFSGLVAAVVIYHLSTEDYEREATNLFVACMELREKNPTLTSSAECHHIKEKTLLEGKQRIQAYR